MRKPLIHTAGRRVVLLGVCLSVIFLEPWRAPARAGQAEEEMYLDLDIGGAEQDVGDKVSADMHYKLGMEYFKREQFDQADAEFKKALEAYPNHALAHYGLGYCQEAQDNIMGAVREYLVAKRLDPESYEVCWRLGEAYRSMGLVDRAVSEYRSALEANPEFLEGYINIGLLYKEQGMLGQAADAFRGALNLDPQNKFAIVNLTNCLKGQKKFQEARQELQKLKEKISDPQFIKIIDVLLSQIKSG